LAFERLCAVYCQQANVTTFYREQTAFVAKREKNNNMDIALILAVELIRN